MSVSGHHPHGSISCEIIFRLTKLVPSGSSRPDWQIVCGAARALGANGFDYQSPQEIWDEIRMLCEGARGMTYARLDERGLQWPCPSETHPGTTLLHSHGFAAGPRDVSSMCSE